MSEGVKRYGETKVEQVADDSLRCRQITRTVIEYGVTEAQKLKLIYMLALELENREHLQRITAVVKGCEVGDAKSTLITKV